MRAKITFEGPFFKGDPTKTFRQNVRLMMDRVAAEGEASVRSNMGSDREAQAVRPYVVGRTKSLGGRRWAVSGTVSVNTAGLSRSGAIRIKAIAAGRKRGTRGVTLGVEGESRVFARVTTAMRRSRAANMEELIKGLQ